MDTTTEAITPPIGNPGTPVFQNQSPYVPDTSSVAGSVASTQSLIDTEVKRAETLAKEEVAAKATAAKTPGVSSMADYLKTTGQETPQQYQTEQYSKIGVNPTDYFNGLQADVESIKALQTDLNDSIAARDKQVADIMGRPGISLDFQNNQIAQINRNANVVIGQKTANLNTQMGLIEMKKGNFNEAQNFVKQAVDAYTSGLSSDLKLFQEFQQNNQDLIDGLDKKYQTAITDAYNLKKQQLDETKAEKDKVGNLMLQFPNAGINLADTLEQAQIKASRVAGQKTDIIGTADTGYKLIKYDSSGKVISSVPVGGGSAGGGSGKIFTQTQINKGAVNAGVSMDEFAKLDTDSKNYFINSLPQINAWKKLGDRQKMLDEIGISTQPQGVKDVLTKYVNAKYPADQVKTESGFKWYNPFTWYNLVP